MTKLAAVVLAVLVGLVVWSHSGTAHPLTAPAWSGSTGNITPSAVLDVSQVESAPLPACAPVMADDVAPEVWDDLLAAGWQGDPTDGMEAVYPPRCDPAYHGDPQPVLDWHADE